MEGKSQEEFELKEPPTDGISSVVFSPFNYNILLVSSWDSGVRLYDAVNNQLKGKYNHRQSVLDCCFQDQNRVLSAGLDKSLRSHDFVTSKETTIGSHDLAIKSVVYNRESDVIVTGSWDKNVKVWDSRSQTPCQGVYEQPDKIYTMDLIQRRLVVGTAGRHVYIYDIRNMSEPLQKRESSLKFQTRSIKCFPNGEGYVLSSIEGRVAVEYFDPSTEMQAKKYAFKCHRVKTDSTETVYPVNAISFHPRYGTFATGGCDGMVCVWDAANKKRLKQYSKYPSSISSISFSHDSKYLAIASSYTYEEGEKDHSPDSIFIREINDADVKPKTPQ